MKLNPRAVFILVTLALSLTQSLQGAWAQPIPALQLGYSPFKLYDANLGTPVYLSRDPLWAYSPFQSTFALFDPGGRRVASKESSGSPVLIHRFTDSDPEGIWVLTTRGRSEEVGRFPIYFVKPSIQPAVFRHSFSLSSSSLAISGTFTMADEPHFPLSVILARRGASNATREFTTDITIGFQNLIVRASHDLEGQQIILTPHFPAPIEGDEPVEIEFSAIVWAELLMDVPLVKVVNPSSSVIAFVKDVVTKTQKVRVNLGGGPEQTMALQLPRRGALLQTGMPPRYGKMEILLNVQTRDTIYLAKMPFYLIPTGNSFGIVGVKEFPPSRVISFSFTDDLIESANYDLILVSKFQGLDILWNTTIAPPLARIFLKNELLNRLESDFIIKLRGDVETAKIGNAAYVVTPAESVFSEFEVVFGGVKLTEEDFSPKTLRLKPQSESYIQFSAGQVAFDVKTRSGQAVDFGSVTLYRTFKDREEFAKVVSLREVLGVVMEDIAAELVSTPGPLNITLPLGTYRAEIRVGDQVQSKTFSVSSPATKVEFIFEEAVKEEESRPVSLLLAIIGAEGVAAFAVWRRALKRRAA